MSLHVVDTTLQECVAATSAFPAGLRNALCRAVQAIDAGELEEILAKHESEDGNLDSTVERNLRQIAPSLQIEANKRISSWTRFDNDLLMEQGNAFVCVEIEKGDTARFEFDILKMQAFASQCKERHPDVHVFGAFIVPFENLVARHISGNARESSYKYLTRLSKLVAQIKPALLEDILILGYGRTTPKEKQRRRKMKKNAKRTGVLKMVGLIPDKHLPWLAEYPRELLDRIRAALASGCPELMEKSNPAGRYLGYANANASDAAYIYVQKKVLVIDLDVSPEKTDEITALGFEVKPRNNWQATKKGWLTGFRVPHDAVNHQEIVSLLLEALRKNA